MAKKNQEVDAVDEVLGEREPMTMEEVGDPGPIERVSESHFEEEAELEAFMHEPVTIMVHEASDQEAIEIPVVNVNGINQPFFRGKEITVKRKYVEQLARTRITIYKQKPSLDPNALENIRMEEKTALAYPFTVVMDKNPKGKPWLKAILAQYM